MMQPLRHPGLEADVRQKRPGIRSPLGFGMPAPPAAISDRTQRSVIDAAYPRREASGRTRDGRGSGFLLRQRAGSGGGAAPLEPVDDAPQQQNADEESVLQRFAHVGFHEPVVVDDAGNRRDINEAVEHLPAAAAEAANPSGGGSERERNQQDEAEKADGDERTLVNVLPHGVEIERLIGAEIGEEVQAHVEKREEAEHAAEANEFRKIERFAKRRDAERKYEEEQSPIAGGVLQRLDRIGTEIAAKSAPAQSEERNQADEK